jgi:DNA repair exonuclease SbcCD ATPase subunit
MEPVFKDSISDNNIKKLSENINYLEKENEDLRERIYDLENSLSIHKNIMNALSESKNFDPQARYLTEQLNQESELLHSKIEKLNKEKSDLRSQVVIKKQMEIQEADYISEEVKQWLEELEEMKASLDRKEYLLQYWEQRNTEMEKLLKKRAGHDEYIKKRLDHLAIEPEIERTIRNVVEDLTWLKEENENYKRENKSLKDQLDYAISNGTGGNVNDMTIFTNNIKPTPQLEDLNRLKTQTKSKDLYAHKLEEMVRSYMEKLEKFKDDIKDWRNQNSLLKDQVSYSNNLSEKLKKALVKYKTKCEELEQKVNDKGVKVWVKENAAVMRVKPSEIVAKLDDDSDIDLDDLKVDLSSSVHETKNGNGNSNTKDERVVDEFAAQEDSFGRENGEGKLDVHFPDESTIVINFDHDDHNIGDEDA